MEAKDGNEYQPATFRTADGNAPAEESTSSNDAGYESDGLSAIDRQYATQTNVHRRIHILGTGSIGKLVAHSLRGIANPPPITLIFHRYKLLQAWQESKKVITIQDDDFPVSRGGFDVELMAEVRREHGVEVEEGAPGPYEFGHEVKPHEAAEALKEQRQEQQQFQQRDAELAKAQQQHQQQDVEAARARERSLSPRSKSKVEAAISHEPIHNLIITTKAAFTVPALNAVKHRLTPSSTICFLQNGMGIIDDVNKQLFPNEEERPNYMQGIITHGANVPAAKAEQDPFFAVHAGHGTIALGLLPRSGMQKEKLTAKDGKDAKNVQSEKWAPSSRYLLRTLTRCPVLCAVGFTPTELLQQQLEKLAVNSIVNPLTALIDNRNGTLLYNFALTRTMRLLLAETSHVIRSLPELQNIPNLNVRFSPERLETLVVSVTNKTRDNISSMLADIRGGRKTEVEYINGYIVRRGEEIGIKCVVNYAIMQTVIGKSRMTQRERQDEVPMERSSRA